MKAERVATSSLRRMALAVAVASCFAGYAQANPTNPTVVSGAATFALSGKNLNVTNTPGAIINWQGFSVKADELTRFIQQNAQSAVLNRVTSQEQSAILGQLQSNGRVYLINPNGITIGAGARVDTAGFVASSLNLSDGDALAGKFRLQDTGSSGKVVNNGTITTATGGFVYLVAPNVENNGIITSPKGEIILAAGKTVELVDSQKPELRVQLTAPENTAINVGKMIAEAGSIGIFAGAIKQSGLVSANSAVVGENGRVIFKATKDVSLAAGSSTTANGPTGGSISIQSDAGTAAVAGVVEANGTQGKGGTIAVAAPQGVKVEPTARITANGTEGGSVTLTSTAGSVTVAAPVSANASVGRAGDLAVSAATTAALASTGLLSASGGQGGGVVSVKGSGGVTLDVGSVVQASGAAGGSVIVQADQGAVEAHGAIDVRGNEEAGGNIQIAARSDITLDVGSQLFAGGRFGGEVRIESGEGTLLVSGLIDGQGKGGPGGRVWLLAPRVGLIREAAVDVSGRTGGGTVLVGGDFQGKNPDVQNAQRTYVGKDVTIKADAIESGDGGKVIVWADGETRYLGSISARGGQQGGDGGNVEVSGKNALDFRGRVDTRAPSGRAGTVLLDPDEIVISNTTDATTTGTGTENTDPFVNDGTVASSNLSHADIEAALNTTNVQVKTSGNANGGNGSITVVSVITAPATTFGLTLDASNSIVLSANIDFATNASSGSVTLSAAAGSISRTGGATIRMGTGPLALVASTGIGSFGTPILTTGVSDLAAATDTGGIFVSNSGGNINVTSITPTVATIPTITGVATTTSGDISLNNSAGSITFTNDVSVGGTTDAITVVTDNIVFVSGKLLANGTTGKVTVAPSTVGTVITVGNTPDEVEFGASAFTTTGNITAGTLQVGDSNNSGGIAVAGPFDPSFTGTTLHLRTGGNITDPAGGHTIGGANVSKLALSAAGDIGASGAGNALATKTGTLAAKGANVYVIQTGAVILNDVNGVSNTAGGTYELTANNTITVTGANIGGGTLTALTASTNDIAGTVTGSVSGASVALKAAGDIGASGAGGALATVASSKLAAQATNVYVSNTGAVSLEDVANSIATVTNAATGSYEVTNDNTITVTGTITSSTGSVTVAAAGDLTVNNNVTANSVSGTGAAVNLTAGSGATAGKDFTQTSGLISSSGGDINILATRNISSSRGAQANAITSSGGDITLNADTDQVTSSGGAIALTKAIVNSAGGAIKLGGGVTPATLAAIGAGGLAEGVKLNNAQLLSGAGSISVRGTGLAGTSNAAGILISNGSVVEATGAGTITLTGIGGSGTSGGSGVRVSGTNTRVTSTSSGSGPITITGTGVGSTTGNHGVSIDAGARVESLATGALATISITGTGGAGTNNNYGFTIDGANSKLASAGGAINVSANRGSATGSDNYGIFVNGGGLAEYTGTGTGSQLVLTGGGAATGSNNNHGIRVSNATVRSTQTGNISMSGTGAGSGANNNGILIDTGGSVTVTQAAAGGGSISLTGFGGHGAGGSNYGVTITSASSLSSAGSGTIMVDGFGGVGGGDSDIGVLLTDTNSKITSNNGLIGVTGFASAGGGNLDSGVALYDGGTIQSTGTANILVTGMANAASASNNRGVLMAATGSTGGTIDSVSGSISVFGTGKGSGSGNIGVDVSGNSAIQSSGSAMIDLTGTGGAGTSGNAGVRVTGAGSRLTTTTTSAGWIAVTGTGGAASTTGNSGVVVDSAGRIESLTAGSAATISVTGTGGTGTNSNYGVSIDGANSKLASAGASVNITGNRGNATGSDNYGIFVNNGGLAEHTGTFSNQLALTGGGAATGSSNNHGIRVSNATVRSTQTGHISMTGTGAGSGSNNNGILIDTGGSVTVTQAAAGGGSISLTGTGGNGAGASNVGVIIDSGSLVSSAGSGTITVSGTGGAGGGDSNIGVWITDANSKIISANGAIGVTGNASAGGGNFDSGVALYDGGAIQSTGTARISVTGNANGASASNNRGVYLREATASAGGGSITSTGSTITVVGTGTGTGSNNTGITLENSSTIQSTTGTIELTGMSTSIGASSNDGIALTSAAGTTKIISASGLIQLKGTKGTNGTDIRLANNPTIGGTTSATSSSDILLEAVGNTGITTDANIATSGSVTLNASAGGVITQTGGKVVATGGANSALRVLGDPLGVTSTVANLSSGGNDINVLVVNLLGATSKLSYRDANGFDIGSLNKPITQGVVSVNHDGITVGTAAGATNNTLTLNAFGAVTQSQTITAGALQLLGGADVSYTLINALNDITTLAASTSGPISYRDANSYAVGTVASTNQFSVATIPSGSATNGTTETGAAGNFTATTVGIRTTAGGALQLDVPGTLTINNDISTDGAFAQISAAGTGSVAIASPRSISTTGDAVSFASPITLNGAGTTAIDTTAGASTAGANVTFSSTLTGTTASAENLTINAGSGGAVTFNNTVGTTRLGDVTISRARDVTLQSSFNAKTLTQSQGATGAPSTSPSVGTTTINGAVDTTGNTSFATSGALNVTGAGSITTGAGSTVTLTSGNDMTLSGNVTAAAGATLNVTGTDRILTQDGGTLATTNSAIALIADEMMLTSAINSGGGAVTLKPNNTTDAIQLGVATAATNNAAGTLELANSELNTITTTGGLTVGAANNTGAITVAGALTPTTAQNGFTLINNTGGIAISAPVTYAAGNGNLTLSAKGGGAAAGAITTNGSALDVSGTLAMNAATGVGSLASPIVLSHAAGTTVTVTNTTSGGVFERADAGDLNVISISNSAAAGGGINLNVGTNLNINGAVQNTIGDVLLVTGNDAAYTAAGGFGLSPAAVAAGTLGGVNLNGQVIANNGGGISIFSTGAVKQSTSVAAGLQSVPATGTVAQGPLKVRTFNSGAQVGVIDLQNNLGGSGNAMGPITLEARLAGSTNPPPYALSNIEYRSINGTSISGIGTAADFSLVAPSQTIDLAPGASLSGANVSLIATAGDVTVKSAITNAQINGGASGGSLNLYASGNIILNNPGGSSSGVVIGRDLGTLDKLGNREFEKFDHTLKLVASGDVRIFGTVEVTGDLALRANAGASEASGPGGVAGFGAGSGSVIIAGSAGNPVEVRAKNIVVGVKDASGNPLPVQNLVIDNSANTAGSGKFFDSTLRAEKKLDIYLNGDQGGAGTSGNIVITGGSASSTSTGIAGAAVESSALAAIRGEVITILGVRGGAQITLDPDTQTVNPLAPYTTNSSNITLNGGTASSDTKAGGGALAAADALILGTSSKFIDIGGNLVLTGGTADSKNGGQTSAGAKIDPVSLRLNTGGYIKLIGGTGAGATAAIVNSGDMEINIGGKFDYTYTDENGTHTVPNVGLLMEGGVGSGIFDRNNQPITLYYDVSSQVLLLFPGINGGAGGGSYFLRTDATKASAFIQSLSPRGFDDSLMSYIIFAANEETRTGRIRTGVSAADDSSKPSCN